MKCIEDEIPFDVPEGWEWCRLKSLAIKIGAGSTPTGGASVYSLSDGIKFIRSQNVYDDGLRTEDIAYISEEINNKKKGSIVKPKDILLNITGGSIGRCALISDDFDIGNVNQHVMIIRMVEENIRYYIHKTILSPYIQNQIFGKQVGSGRGGLSAETLSSFLIPLPPMREQERIISTSSDAISLITRIANNKESLAHIIGLAKTKILEKAIRGELVPQLEDDNSAQDLLDKIILDKSQKSTGKKNESVIFRGDDNSYYVNIDGDTINITDELPFEIPDSWAWGKLQDVFIVNPKNQLDDDLDVSFIPMPRINDGFTGTHTSESRKWREIKKGFTHFKEGDVVVAKITPCFENRKSAIMSNLINGYGAGTTELHVIRPYKDTILPEYILTVMKSNYFIDLGKQTFSGAVGQQRFSKEFFMGFYFPIPPLEEQKRIVSQIRCLFSKLNIIEKSLS